MQGPQQTTVCVQRLDDIISPLIRQGQSIHQICVNNADDIMCDERSIYNYVDAGILSVGNIDLPRKVRYRKRKKKKVDLMMSHINSYTRKKLNDRSAYQLFSFFYGRDTLDNLNIRSINANEIILKPELLRR